MRLNDEIVEKKLEAGLRVEAVRLNISSAEGLME